MARRKTLTPMSFDLDEPKFTEDIEKRKINPQLIATNKLGVFRITPEISKALEIRPGDHIMFLNNANDIDNAIDEQVNVVVEFCKAEGLNPESETARIMLHNEFDMWGIAKGICERHVTGHIRMIADVLSVQEKQRYVAEHFDELMKKASVKADENTKNELYRENITRMEQINILSKFIVSRKKPKFKGSLVKNLSNINDATKPLIFKDLRVWKELKANLGNDAKKINRIFTVDISNTQVVTIYDGYQMRTIKAILIDKRNYEDLNIS